MRGRSRSKVSVRLAVSNEPSCQPRLEMPHARLPCVRCAYLSAICPTPDVHGVCSSSGTELLEGPEPTLRDWVRTLALPSPKGMAWGPRCSRRREGPSALTQPAVARRRAVYPSVVDAASIPCPAHQARRARRNGRKDCVLLLPDTGREGRPTQWMNHQASFFNR
jgi:hypothetical protein